MSMQERFTDEEWRLVRHIPFDAFMFGALADGKVEDSELKAFGETLDRAPTIKDPLHREIALSYAAAGPAEVLEELQFQMSESASQMEARMAQTKPVLQQKLTRPEYQSFFKSVWISAMGVASASTEKKKHFWAKEKQPISDAEAAALAAFAMKWEVDLSFLEAHVA